MMVKLRETRFKCLREMSKCGCSAKHFYKNKA